MGGLIYILAACASFLTGFGLNLLLPEVRPFSLFSVVGSVLIVPMLEEAVFRAGLIGLLSRHTKLSPWACAGLSAVLFSFYHMANPILMPYALVMGVLLGLIYVKAGKLDAPLGCHMAANAAAAARSCLSAPWTGAVMLSGFLLICCGVALWIYTVVNLTGLPDSDRFRKKPGAGGA